MFPDRWVNILWRTSSILKIWLQIYLNELLKRHREVEPWLVPALNCLLDMTPIVDFYRLILLVEIILIKLVLLRFFLRLFIVIMQYLFFNHAGNLYGFGCTTPSISFSAFPSTISSLLYITFEYSVWHSWSYLPPNLSVCLSLLYTWYHPSPPFDFPFRPFTLCLSFILPIYLLLLLSLFLYLSRTSLLSPLPLSPTLYIPDRLNGTEMQHPMITLPAVLTAQGQGQDLLLIPQGMIITLRWMREKKRGTHSFKFSPIGNVIYSTYETKFLFFYYISL